MFKILYESLSNTFRKNSSATRGRSEEDARPRIVVESKGYRGKEGQDGEGKLCTLAIYADPEFLNVHHRFIWKYVGSTLPSKLKPSTYLLKRNCELSKPNSLICGRNATTAFHTAVLTSCVESMSSLKRPTKMFYREKALFVRRPESKSWLHRKLTIISSSGFAPAHG